MKKTRLIWMAAVMLFMVSCGNEGNSTAAAEMGGMAPEISVEQTSGETVQDHQKTDPKEIKIIPFEIDYIYDPDIPEQAAYYNDNIFAAVVVEVGENYDPYWEPEYVEQYGAASVYEPCYTKYQLQVTQVIKGDLQQGDIINSRKMGYFDEEEQAYCMVESGVMPVAGKEYLFLANHRMDDKVYQLNHTIPLEENASEIPTYKATIDAPDRQSIIERYIAAHENETPYEEPNADDNGNPLAGLE